jgi:hypothetical protein
MSAFKSHWSYGAFAHAVQRRTRYVHDDEVEAFLGTLLVTSEGRTEKVGPTGILWRAQLGHDWRPIGEEDDESAEQVQAPYPPDRMKPRTDRATEGRANPKGIPHLYLSTERETAMAEVRPWIGSLISVAQFALQRELRIVNCTNDDCRRTRLYLHGEPSAEERERCVWGDVNRAFSTPVTLNDEAADYVPTQIIAEMFRANGLDGIAYGSALGPGHNVVLFDLDAALLLNCFLFAATKLSFVFSEAGNPYFMERDEPEGGSGSQGA